MRTVNVSEITENIKEMCIEANHYLSKDMEATLKHSQETEASPLGRQILGQLSENLQIAADEMIPICQDTGMAVVFLEVGQDVHLEGGAVEEAVNEGVRKGYTEGYLRKSVVGDPIERVNTGDNTPAVIHYSIVPGDTVRITVAPKGFGSENMSRVFMLKPADGIEGVKDAILKAVSEAGPNACPPMVVGVGIGGTFEKCALMAKQALTRETGLIPRFRMSGNWKRKCWKRSTDLESVRADLEALQQLWQFISILIRHILQDFRWRSIYAATSTGILSGNCRKNLSRKMEYRKEG